ncbi:MAG TPA: class I SAM-dependent methyltransferase, partial [Fibrobacteraceae bacterium]|nr:class I SAM-dependent methyltransferase [Fibrobacteraceae bacterium]
VTRADAIYHSDMRDSWIDANQMRTLRNLVFHRKATQLLLQDLPVRAVILELGSGVGFDADLVMAQHPEISAYLLSEISPELVSYAKRSNPHLSADSRVIPCCLDGDDLLLESSQVDRILLVAALHHLPNLSKALAEMDRVCRPGARLIFAMEPNRFWLALIARLRPVYRRFFAKKAVSAADEEAEGFVPSDFVEMARTHGWKLDHLVPVWFLAGFVHQGLEAFHRLFRLKRRLVLPFVLERLILALDRLFFGVPGSARLAWHYTVVFQK